MCVESFRSVIRIIEAKFGSGDDAFRQPVEIRSLIRQIGLIREEVWVVRLSLTDRSEPTLNSGLIFKIL